MQEIAIGDIIKQRRIKLRYTQQQLCEGICSSTTLSRIENGGQVPSRHVIAALFQRLGMPDNRFFLIISQNDAYIESLQKEIVSLNVDRDRSNTENASKLKEQIQDKLKYLESIIDDDDLLMKQFIIRIRANIADNFADQIDELIKALKITVPDFSLTDIANGLYTFEEIKIINHIAGIYREKGQTEITLSMMEQLFTYIKQHLSEVPSRRYMTLIAMNYARILYEVKSYEKALAIAKYGKDACVQYGCYENLGGLLEMEAKCRETLGQHDIAIRLFRQAYYLHEATNNEKGLERIKELIKYYNITDLIL